MSRTRHCITANGIASHDGLPFDRTRMTTAALRETKLSNLISELGVFLADGLVIAFSGGVDSSFLLWAATEARKLADGRLLAITTVSPSVPKKDVEDAVRFAERIGVDCELVESGEFGDERYLRNDAMRCYFCKSELFQISDATIQQRDFRYVAYGYTATDMGDTRPGHRAANEHGVLYPLADHGFSKDEIREHMHLQGFEMAEKPASPCLSSRVMTGVRINSAMLDGIDELETLLRNGGLRVFRVRHHDDGESQFIRLEVAPREMETAMTLKEDFVAEAKRRGYRWVTLDLEGYRTGGANR